MKNSWNLLSRLSKNFTLVVSVLVFIPALILIGIGFYWIYSEGYILYLLSWLLFSTLVLYLVKKKKEKDIIPENEIEIEASPQSSEFDNEVREKIYRQIDIKTKNGLEWKEFQAYSITLISEVATFYNPKQSEKELAFSIPEALYALETLSGKYRKIMIKFVPSIAHQIPLSFYMNLLNHKNKGIATGKFLNLSIDAYRLYRMVNPINALISEITSKISNEVLGEVASTMQDKIKRALLKELVSVMIDLYRGGYKSKDSELGESKIASSDKMNSSKNIEPLRVSLIGQIGAGKSSVINALVEKTVAEVSSIPTTDKTIIHNWNIDKMKAIKLVDLPGLDGNKETNELILKELTESDLVFWVLKANQSARKLDVDLKKEFDDFYKKRENLKRKKPIVIAVLNQVDKLKPINEWDPPYDVISCNSDNKKACVIRDALKYNQEILKPNHTLPLSLKENQQFNLDEVEKLLQKAYENGIHTQLNRRKLEDNSDGVIKSGEKIWKTVKTLF